MPAAATHFPPLSTVMLQKELQKINATLAEIDRCKEKLQEHKLYLAEQSKLHYFSGSGPLRTRSSARRATLDLSALLAQYRKQQ